MLLHRIKYALCSRAYPTDPVGHVACLSDPEGPDNFIEQLLLLFGNKDIRSNRAIRGKPNIIAKEYISY
jgi:hypothetical protein